MIELIRRHAVLLSIALFIWYAWSSLTVEEGEKAAEAKKLDGIDAARYLAARAADASLPPLDDPYRFGDELPETLHGPVSEDADAGERSAAEGRARPIATPYIPTSLLTAMPAIEQAARLTAPWSERLATSVSAWLQPWRGQGPGEHAGAAHRDGAPDATAPLAPPTVRLWVDAVLTVGETRQARVSGATVGVGGALDGLDPEAPPRVVAIHGLAVEVLYRDRTYLLELGGDPLLVQGQTVLGVPGPPPEETPR